MIKTNYKEINPREKNQLSYAFCLGWGGLFENKMAVTQMHFTKQDVVSFLISLKSGSVFVLSLVKVVSASIMPQFILTPFTIRAQVHS